MADLLLSLVGAAVGGGGGGGMMGGIFPLLANGLIGMDSPPNRVDVARARYESQSVRPVVPYAAPIPYTGGRVRALFIGINYTGTRNELSGCVNDVDQMIGTLRRINFPISECCILVDRPSFPNFTALPTRANIVRHMAWLSSNVRPGDVLFLHYSGHGGQVRATADTAEEYDQCLIPLDYEQCGGILDDDLFNLLVRELPAGVRMTCVFDCCHSASMLDLPFSFVGARDMRVQNTGYTMRMVRRNNFAAADVVMFSGCDDAGTSADVRSGGRTVAGGAATQAFTWALVYTCGLNYMDILLRTRDILRSKGFRQVPQLTSSKPVDLYKPFSLFGAVSVNQQMMQQYVPAQYRYAPPPSAAPAYAPPPPPQAYYPPPQPPPQQQPVYNYTAPVQPPQQQPPYGYYAAQPQPAPPGQYPPQTYRY